MSEANKATFRRLFEEGVNEGDMAVVDEIVDATFTYHGSGQELSGPDGLKQLIGMYRTAFPDIELTIEDQVAEGDKVVTRWTGRGTHEGELQGIAPTGKQITVTGISTTRYAGGKIAEEWEIIDQLGMLQQLGVVPPLEG